MRKGKRKNDKHVSTELPFLFLLRVVLVLCCDMYSGYVLLVFISRVRGLKQMIHAIRHSSSVLLDKGT